MWRCRLVFAVMSFFFFFVLVSLSLSLSLSVCLHLLVFFLFCAFPLLCLVSLPLPLAMCVCVFVCVCLSLSLSLFCLSLSRYQEASLPLSIHWSLSLPIRKCLAALKHDDKTHIHNQQPINNRRYSRKQPEEHNSMANHNSICSLQTSIQRSTFVHAICAGTILHIHCSEVWFSQTMLLGSHHKHQQSFTIVIHSANQPKSNASCALIGSVEEDERRQCLYSSLKRSHRLWTIELSSVCSDGHIADGNADQGHQLGLFLGVLW